MTKEHNVNLVKTALEELFRGNPAPLLSALTEDALVKAIIPEGTPISGDFRGRDGFLRYFGALNEVMEILEIRVSDYTASVDHVVVLGFERARVKRTGQVFECETATVYELSQGKIAKVLALADMSAIVKAYSLA